MKNVTGRVVVVELSACLLSQQAISMRPTHAVLLVKVIRFNSR